MSGETRPICEAATCETPFVFSNARGEQLVGIFHEAESPSGDSRGALLLLHGWSGYRVGPHRMLTHAARWFGERGWSSLRFDFAGRGDADGDFDLATLATMRDDARVALRELQQRTNGPIWLVGLCSGCEIAVALGGDETVQNQLAGAILWSAPIFAHQPDEANQAQKRGANLRKYAQKLLQLSTYRKLLKGEVDTQAVAKAARGVGGAASKNVESNEPGQLPPGFRANVLRGWRAWKRPVFQVYGGADPIVDDARSWYEKHSASAPEVHIVEGANHSFYGLLWEREVFEATEKWLKERVFDLSPGPSPSPKGCPGEGRRNCNIV